MSTVNDVIVSYGGDSKRYSRDFQTKEEFKKSWYAVLSRAHASVEAKVSCACKGKGQKSLAVKYHSGGDTYFLARYPNTGWASWVAPAGPLPHLPDKGCS